MDFVDKFSEFSNLFNPLLSKYSLVFQKIFERSLLGFEVVYWKDENSYLILSNSKEIERLFFETHAYNRYYLADQLVNGYCGFKHLSEDYQDSYRSKFYLALKSNLDIDFFFYTVEAYQSGLLMYKWYFKNIFPDEIIEREENLVYKLFANQGMLIRACLEQFKKDFFLWLDKEKVSYKYSKNLQFIPYLASVKKKSIKKRSEILLNSNTMSNSDLYLQYVQFTKREKECISHYIRGMTAKEIGKKLKISSRTIEEHLCKIKTKLNEQNRFEIYLLSEKLKLMGVI